MYKATLASANLEVGVDIFVGQKLVCHLYVPFVCGPYEGCVPVNVCGVHFDIFALQQDLNDLRLVQIRCPNESAVTILVRLVHSCFLVLQQFFNNLGKVHLLL